MAPFPNSPELSASADCWANLPEMNSCKQTCLKSIIDPMSEVTKLANAKDLYGCFPPQKRVPPNHAFY